MARTHTRPMDYMTKETHYAHMMSNQHSIMEQGRKLFSEEVLSPLMGALKAADPDWENWYDETIPEMSSLKQIAELVSDRIVSIECEDYRDEINTIRSIISTFYS